MLYYISYETYDTASLNRN